MTAWRDGGIPVSGFRFPVSDFRFPVSGFRIRARPAHASHPELEG